MAYRFTARRRAALKRAAAVSASKRKRGKKPYSKTWGARNRNGQIATKRQRTVNRAKAVGKVAVASAYVGGYAYVAAKDVKRTRARESAKRKVIQSRAASYSPRQAEADVRRRIARNSRINRSR